MNTQVLFKNLLSLLVVIGFCFRNPINSQGLGLLEKAISNHLNNLNNLNTTYNEPSDSQVLNSISTTSQITSQRISNSNSQSPIAINSNSVIGLNQNILNIIYHEIKGKFIYEEPERLAGNTFKLTIPADDFTHEVIYSHTENNHITKRSYYLRNVHIHIPAEHILDKKRYPIEFHFVHSMRNSTDNQYSNLVLGIMGQAEDEDKNCSEMFKGFKFKEVESTLTGLDKLNKESYYFYKGSLKTLPFTENVLWFVFKNAKKLKKGWIFMLGDVIGHNNRKIKENHNKVYLHDGEI